MAIRDLEVYVHGSEERLIQAARGDKIDRWFRGCKGFEKIKEIEKIKGGENPT